ncbi:hypothetical protein ACSVXJ_002918 [Providencia rettgeri]|uniref:Uncharacterized protein n=1 Tax=Providencia rettgeri TaxID=587 RepID=A0AAW6UNC7_PRORE|nr:MULTISPECIES: hypothetical protein [Providencia]MBN6361582.1 hypothetical protein [Providencia huaxiensis]MDI9095427.1 hypothetical protein [Providencia rettgeri]MDT2038830.1 hypothetical protein [Providencia rettgeri]UEK61611.1 hypothetical protein LL668_21010 [Providencia rettgeri]
MASLEERLFQFKVMRCFVIVNLCIVVINLMGCLVDYFTLSFRDIPYISILVSVSAIIVVLMIGDDRKASFISGKVGFPSRKKMVLFIIKCLSVYVFFFSVGLAIRFS